MGGVGRFIAGAALVGLAFVPGLGPLAGGLFKTFLLTTGLGLASSAVAQQFTARGLQGYAQDATLDPEATLPIVYGSARLAPRWVDVRTAGPKNRYLYLVGALCHGSQNGSGIESIGAIYFDGQLAVNAGGVVQGKWAGRVTVTKYLGTHTQAADATMTSTFGAGGGAPAPWTSTSRGLGVAYIILRLEFDPDVFPGIPEIMVDVQGCRVYDPRTASWVWSMNPALCLLDYLTSAPYGGGVSLGECNLTAFNAMADYCGQIVTVPGDYPAYDPDTEFRFLVNGALDTGQSLENNVALLLTSCRGNLVFDGGQFRPFIRREQAPVAFQLTEDTIVGDWDVIVPGTEAPNAIRFTYVSPGDDFQPVEAIWPRPGAANPYRDADGGVEIERPIQLPLTQSPYMAERIAIVELQEQRDSLSVQLTATEAALVLQLGDVVTVTHPVPGWTAKPFWVMGFAFDPASLTCRLALVEYNAAAYVVDPQTPQPPSPNTSLPDVGSCDPPSGLTLGSTAASHSQLPAGEFTATIAATWTASPDPYLERYELQVKKQSEGASAWKTLAVASRTDTVALLAPVAGGTAYDVRISALNVLGVRSAWVTGTVTTAIPPGQSKTIRLHASLFRTGAPLADYAMGVGTVALTAAADGKTTAWYAPLLLPQGVIITEVRLRWYGRYNGLNGDTGFLNVYRVTDAGGQTFLGGAGQVKLSTGEDTSAVLLNETVLGSEVYTLEVALSMNAAIGTGTTPYPAFRWAELTYTMPSLERTL